MSGSHRRRLLAGLIAVWLAIAFGAPARTRADACQPVTRVDIEGARRTRHSTLLELLPRPAPTCYYAWELRELERRVGNLGLFDKVEVRTQGRALRIAVREKWTLIPEFDLARGTTAADIYVLLGVTEYNAFGTGSALGLSVYRERRGYGFSALFAEHVYRRSRWALAGEAAYGSSYFRFAGDDAWYNQTALLYFWTTSTPIVSDHARYELGTFYKHEVIDDVEGEVRPPNGHVWGSSMMFTWDAYQWDDLTPHGVSFNFVLVPGFFFGPPLPQRRHSAEIFTIGAYKLTGTTALVTRVKANVNTLGNANHSSLIGSVEGVRGLEDVRYFNWMQAFCNLELRQAVRLAPRWALQGVLFTDAAIYEGVTARGGRGEVGAAFSGGAGVRLVPTWLRGIVLRFDVARLVLPERSFFYQYGLGQYF